MARIKPYKLFYIHIPKTGGNTVLSNLHNVEIFKPKKRDYMSYMKQPLGEMEVTEIEYLAKKYIIDHRTYSRDQIKKMIYLDYLPFTTIRNPYQRAYSMFQWHRYKMPKNGKRIPDDFKMWLFNSPDKMKIFKPQSTWLLDADGVLPIKWCKIENIKEEIKPIYEHIGVDLKEDNFVYEANRNPLRENNYDYRVHYDEECFEKVNEIYKSDIELFDYTF